MTPYMKTFLYHAVLSLVVPLLSGIAAEHRVDFRYAPHGGFTIICMPYDWLKTVVTPAGALGYDFGPGPYARPLTEISVTAKEYPTSNVRQYIADARVPQVVTEFSSDIFTMQQTAFSLVPAEQSLRPRATGRVKRLGGLNGCRDWAVPPAGTDSAFRSVAWGTNRSIHYQVTVPPLSEHTVVLGFCEPYKPRAGARVLLLDVEGSEPVTFDPMESGVQNDPQVVHLRGRDLDGDGLLGVDVRASTLSPDPNVILNALWLFAPSDSVSTPAIIHGEASSRAEVYYDCGNELESSSSREDGIIVSFSSGCTPVISVRTRRHDEFDPATRTLMSAGLPYVSSNPRPVHAQRDSAGWTLTLPAGTTEAEVLVSHGGTHEHPPGLAKALEQSRDYWLHTTFIPRNTMTVPDTGIQFLLDASLRTVYQVADIVDGRRQFQPGPSVYRGLWPGDLVLVVPPMLFNGDTSRVREYIERCLSFQAENGRIRVIEPVNALIETPMTVFAMCLYARTMNNKAWLKTHWGSLSKAVEWIEAQRKATLAVPGSPYEGLMPPGFVDGGIATPTADYGTLWWAMIALERASDAARWLGMPEKASTWSSVLKDFTRSFHAAARRDLRTDVHGNTYLPVRVGNEGTEAPEKGQYAFLLPVRQAGFFQQRDPLIDSIVTGNLHMLDATFAEGLPANSGWLSGAVWPWLGGVQAIARLVYGDRLGSIDMVYAVANHALPTGTWVEEQLPRALGSRTAGDASDAEASSVFFWSVRDLIAQERADGLALLAGVPSGWIFPGSSLSLTDALTEFGPVTITVSCSARSVSIDVSPIDGHGTKNSLYVCLDAFPGYRLSTGGATPSRVRGTWGKPLHILLEK